MKINAIKVDIVKVPMVVHSPTVYFGRFEPGIEPLLVDEGTLNKIDHFKDRYDIVRLHHPDGRELRNYLVKTDDRGIFEELVMISNDLIKTKINKEVNKRIEEERMVSRETFDDMINQTRSSTITEIKRLPWWKRMLGRF